LGDAGVRPLQASLDALWRLIGEFDGDLQSHESHMDFRNSNLLQQ
jgi:hypothetical protein